MFFASAIIRAFAPSVFSNVPFAVDLASQGPKNFFSLFHMWKDFFAFKVSVYKVPSKLRLDLLQQYFHKLGLIYACLHPRSTHKEPDMSQ